MKSDTSHGTAQDISDHYTVVDSFRDVGQHKMGKVKVLFWNGESNIF